MHAEYLLLVLVSQARIFFSLFPSHKVAPSSFAFILKEK